VFISNSTGPIHIAAALGNFIIGFYPKILACSQERWGPYTKNKAVFLPEIDCKDCTREQCEQLDCMNSINYEGVIREVEKELSK
jgi:ADP-heptose:LPS heptosyltransferase